MNDPKNEALQNLITRFLDNPCRSIVAGMNEIEDKVVDYINGNFAKRIPSVYRPAAIIGKITKGNDRFNKVYLLN